MALAHLTKKAFLIADTFDDMDQADNTSFLLCEITALGQWRQCMVNGDNVWSMC